MRYFSDPIRFPEWESSRFDLGSRFIYVNGQCQYWIESDESVDTACHRISDFRTGVMEPHTAKALGDVLFYEDPVKLAQFCIEPSLDSPAFLLWNGVGEFACSYGFKEPAGLNDIYEEILAKSVPFEGKLRIGVAKNVHTESLPKIEKELTWPLSRPIEDFVIPEEAKYDYGGLFLVSDPNEIAKLRALRDQWCDLVRPFGYQINAMINLDRVYKDKGNTVGTIVVYRQELPFVNTPNGLWFPPEIQ